MPDAELSRLIKGFAERITIELAARARDNRPVADDAAVDWVSKQLIGFAFASGLIESEGTGPRASAAAALVNPRLGDSPMIFQSKDFKFPHYGLKAGRIEIDLSVPERPLQRHIWIREDGSEDAEKWIASIRDTPERLLAKGWTQIVWAPGDDPETDADEI